jgi:hypothetical protein
VGLETPHHRKLACYEVKDIIPLLLANQCPRNMKLPRRGVQRVAGGLCSACCLMEEDWWGRGTLSVPWLFYGPKTTNINNKFRKVFIIYEAVSNTLLQAGRSRFDSR